MGAGISSLRPQGKPVTTRSPPLYPPGHLAVAALLSRSSLRARWGSAGLWVVVGAFWPDLLDKSVRALGWLPWGRSIGHSVWFLALLVLGAIWLRERRLAAWRPAAWFALGVTSHLLADLVADVESGLMAGGWVFSGWWAWPWSDADHMAVLVSTPIPARRWFSLIEAGTVLAALHQAAARIRAGATATGSANDAARETLAGATDHGYVDPQAAAASGTAERPRTDSSRPHR